jgi:hypothetical protein
MATGAARLARAMADHRRVGPAPPGRGGVGHPEAAGFRNQSRWPAPVTIAPSSTTLWCVGGASVCPTSLLANRPMRFPGLGRLPHNRAEFLGLRGWVRDVVRGGPIHRVSRVADWPINRITDGRRRPATTSSRPPGSGGRCHTRSVPSVPSGGTGLEEAGRRPPPGRLLAPHATPARQFTSDRRLRRRRRASPRSDRERTP